MKRPVLAAALAWLLAPAWAMASPINYVETTTATGDLGNVPFTNALITITANADTNNVGQLSFEPPGVIGAEDSSATVNVAGVGTATFTVSTASFDNQNTSEAGLAAPTNDILDITNSAFATYNMTSAIGPITGSTFVSSGVSFPTTSGNLVLNSASPTGTFQAIVPEPSSAAIICAVALASLARIRRKLS